MFGLLGVVGRPSLEPSGHSAEAGCLHEILHAQDALESGWRWIFVVEDRCGAQRLGGADGDRKKPESSLRLLDLHARPALDVREQRNKARERERVVLGRP